MRRLVLLIKMLTGLVVVINGTAWALYANPDPFFPHSYSAHDLTLRAIAPIDPNAADPILARAAHMLATSPLGAPERNYTIYDTHNSWRTRLFFASVPRAGGVTYYPFANRQAYLSGLDLKADVLIKGNYRVTPPRTLGYYLVHELTHLRIGELTGPLAYHLLPKWIMEGICDMVALGAMSQEEIRQVIGWQGTSLERMLGHGSYPLERAMVSFADQSLGLSPRDLISEPIERSRIVALMRTAGLKGDF